MIVEFSLYNPWSGGLNRKFASLVSRTWKITKHKFFEIELLSYHEYLLKCKLDIHFRGRDHAGPSLDLVLWKWQFRALLYDCRHWDWINNKWMEKDEIIE